MSYSWSGMGHPPQRSGWVSMMFLALLSCSSSWIFFRWCCLLFLWTRCASDSSNEGLWGVFLHISCSLFSLRLSIVEMRVPSGLCSVLSDGFVGCSPQINGGVISDICRCSFSYNERTVEFLPGNYIYFARPDRPCPPNMLPYGTVPYLCTVRCIDVNSAVLYY